MNSLKSNTELVQVVGGSLHFGDKSIPVSQITSKQITTEEPTLGCLYTLMVIAFSIALSSEIDFPYAILVIIVFVTIPVLYFSSRILLKYKNTTYSLIVETQSGKTEVMTTTDREEVEDISTSIDDLIGDRSDEQEVSSKSESIPSGSPNDESIQPQAFVNNSNEGIKRENQEDLFDRMWSSITETQKYILAGIFSILVIALIIIVESNSAENLNYSIINNNLTFTQYIRPEMGYLIESSQLLEHTWQAANENPTINNIIVTLMIKPGSLKDKYGNKIDEPLYMGVIDFDRDDIEEMLNYNDDSLFGWDEVWQSLIMLKMNNFAYGHLITENPFK
jgi:hypothetical protein